MNLRRFALLFALLLVACPPDLGEDDDVTDDDDATDDDDDVDPSFACGENLTCDRSTQYCFVEYPGVEGADIVHSCVDHPRECLPNVTCECLVSDPLKMECAEAAGAFTLSVYYP